jgi:hypothetical protein
VVGDDHGAAVAVQADGPHASDGPPVDGVVVDLDVGLGGALSAGGAAVARWPSAVVATHDRVVTAGPRAGRRLGLGRGHVVPAGMLLSWWGRRLGRQLRPGMAMWCALLTSRSRMDSATTGLGNSGYQSAAARLAVMMIDRRSRSVTSS